MGNNFTQSDLNNISNQPAVLKIRKYGTTDPYKTSIFTNSLVFSVTPSIATQAFDDTGDLYDYITEETGVITFDYGQVYNTDFFETLGNGLYTIENSASGSVVIVNQDILAGWVEQKLITIDLVDANGTFFVSSGVPVITSVTASIVGALVAGDDYFIVEDPNSKSGYSIMFDSNGTKAVQPAESIIIVYGDVQAFGQTVMSMGGKSNFGAIEGYIETVLRDGTAVRIDVFKGFTDGNYSNNFASENDAVASVTSVTISLKKDTNRVEGKQIASITKIVP